MVGILRSAKVKLPVPKKIMNMSDVQQAALGGEIGDVANIEILRNGNRTSLTVPRGTLGVRLGAARLVPAQ
jgi:hypothetical protein